MYDNTKQKEKKRKLNKGNKKEGMKERMGAEKGKNKRKWEQGYCDEKESSCKIENVFKKMVNLIYLIMKWHQKIKKKKVCSICWKNKKQCWF